MEDMLHEFIVFAIFWSIVLAPILGVCLYFFVHNSKNKIYYLISAVFILLILFSLNKYFHFLYLGSDVLIPILWVLFYVCIWASIINIKSKLKKILSIASLLSFHAILSCISIMPGIWIIGDLTTRPKFFYDDVKVKGYLSGWGNFAHNGINVYVTNRFRIIKYFERIEGPYVRENPFYIIKYNDTTYVIYNFKKKVKTIIIK